MKLEEVLHHYLGTDLEFDHFGDHWKMVGIDTELHIVKAVMPKNKPRNFRIDKIKPILFDLSMLTEEIDHNGEKFKLINRIPLPKSRPTYFQDLIRLSNGEKDFRTFEYQTIELLIKHHFNAFQLPSDLYIKKK